MSDPAGSPLSVTEDEARVWTKAEDVAIHFNEMILNFRLKAVGAVTLAAGLVGSVLLNTTGESVPRLNYVSFAFGMGFLGFVWLAILCLDLFYYHRLLVGAVDEVLRIEKASGGRLQLSMQIKKRAEEGPTDTVARWLFYGLPLAAMISVACVALALAPNPSPPAPAAPRAQASAPSHGRRSGLP